MASIKKLHFNRETILSGLFLLIFLPSLLATLLVSNVSAQVPPADASAPTGTATQVGIATIYYNGNVYTDQNPFDSNHSYLQLSGNGASTTCNALGQTVNTNEIIADPNSSTAQLYTVAPGSGPCNRQLTNLALTKLAPGSPFYVNTDGTVQTWSAQNTFVNRGNGTVGGKSFTLYTDGDPNQCTSALVHINGGSADWYVFPMGLASNADIKEKNAVSQAYGQYMGAVLNGGNSSPYDSGCRLDSRKLQSIYHVAGYWSSLVGCEAGGGLQQLFTATHCQTIDAVCPAVGAAKDLTLGSIQQYNAWSTSPSTRYQTAGGQTANACKTGYTCNAGIKGSCSAARPYRVGGGYDAATIVDYNYVGQTGGMGDTGSRNTTSFTPISGNQGYRIGSGIPTLLASMQQPAGTNTVPPQNANGGAGTTKCEDSDFILSWIMCPIIEGLARAVEGTYNSFIKPLLETNYLQGGGNTTIKQAWLAFRAIGNVFLIIALLVIVFGQSIGGGLIDAYSAKKIVPRLVAAAILINLSYYIVGALVDITNVVGGGIITLITAPFAGVTGDFTLNFSPTSDLPLAAVIAYGGYWAVTATGALLQFLWTMVLLPALLIMLAILVTIILRQGLIIFLIVSAPVAFALYCLPNTEKYFQKWWELLWKTLMVYPIIAVLFGLGKALSATINMSYAGSSGASGTLLTAAAPLLSLVALMAPLFLIPFSFKLAGGVLGRAHDIAMGAQAKFNAAQQSRKDRAKMRLQTARVQRRGGIYQGLNSFGDRHRSVRPFARFAANRVGGYNLEADAAALRAERFKVMQAQNDTGDDTQERALTVNKQWALQHGKKSTDGVTGDWREKDGRREFQTLGGAWVAEADVDSAYKRWGNDHGALQWALGHEMEKATTQEHQDRLATHIGTLVGQSEGNWSMTDGQRAGLWKGSAFSKQAINRQWKHYNIDSEGQLKMNGVGLMREIDEKQGNYQMLQQNADTWTTMSDEVVKAASALDSDNAGITQKAGESDADYGARVTVVRNEATETLERASRIAYATASASYMDTQGVNENGDPVVPPPGAAPRATRAAGSGAPGRTQEEINIFLATVNKHARGYTPPSTGSPTYPRPAPGTGDSLARRRNNDRS